MRRALLHVAVVISALALGTAAASATPPSGVTFEDHGRGQVAKASQVATPAGSQAVSASYTLAPGATTGWRALPGAAILAVTAGTMTVHRAEGCTTTGYSPGQATVLPAGTSMIHNTGSEPLKFLGAFFNLPSGAAPPLSDGADGSADCTGMSAMGAAGAADLAVTQLGAGAFVGPGHYHGHHMHSSEVSPLEAGSDVLFSSYRVEPGGSSGWITHRSQFVIVNSGTLSYYEGQDGKCVKTDEYGPHTAYYHGPHTHLAVNEGKEPLTLTIVHFNVPHNDHPAPVVGNQGDAFDFTPSPPADCPRLR
jgi:quercetin dioxygenase-like cupin family protein